MPKKPSKSSVAAAKKVLKQAGLTGESRKGNAAKTVKAADTSRGEGRRREAAGASRFGRGSLERLSRSGKTASQTVNETRRGDIETAREMIKAGQRILRGRKKDLRSDPTGSKEAGKYVKTSPAGGHVTDPSDLKGRRATKRPGTSSKSDPWAGRKTKSGKLTDGGAYYQIGDVEFGKAKKKGKKRGKK